MKIRITNDVWIACKHCKWRVNWYAGEPRPTECEKCRNASEDEREARRALVEAEARKFHETVTKDPKMIGAAVNARTKALK